MKIEAKRLLKNLPSKKGFESFTYDFENMDFKVFLRKGVSSIWIRRIIDVGDVEGGGGELICVGVNINGNKQRETVPYPTLLYVYED